ncbi:MAG: hypothetical protein IJO48_05555 [Clostridia bacterium]|nr:hypothetical protein [Clostridia bacterium]
MKRDLKSFMRGEGAKLDESAMNNAQDAMNKYSGKSDDELMRELNTLKENGTINNAALQNMASTISPMLNAQQKQKLEALIKQLSN